MAYTFLLFYLSKHATMKCTLKIKLRRSGMFVYKDLKIVAGQLKKKVAGELKKHNNASKTSINVMMNNQHILLKVEKAQYGCQEENLILDSC